MNPSRTPVALGCLLAIAGGVGFRAAPDGGPRTLTPERLEDLVVVSDAVVSPAGDRVLYRVSVPRKAGDDPGGARAELRVVPFAGGVSWHFVGPDSDPSSPAWSPDGRNLSFVSSRRTDEPKDREPQARVFVMPVDGGEARPVTPRDLAVAAYAWSPSGAEIAFTAADPESEARKAARKRGEDWTVVDRDLPIRRLRVVCPSVGVARDLTDARLAVWEFDWSPDGRSIVAAVSDRPRTDDQYVHKRLVIIPVEGGEPRLLVPERGKIASPRWSRDGRSIAYLAALDRHDPSEGTVSVVPAEGGAPRELALGSEVNFRHLAWLPSGKIAASGEEGARTVLAQLSPRGGEPAPVVDRGIVFGSFSVSRDGKRYALAASTPAYPAEAYAGSMAGGAPARLTRDNGLLEGLALGEQGPFRWTARDGKEIEGVLIRPVGFDPTRRWPLLVTPHGGPEFASLDGWTTSYLYLGQVAAARGYLVLLPNYRGSTGRGEAFARADHEDLGGAEFDDVLAGIDALVAKGWADAGRVAIAGGSYGGYFAAWGATRHSGRFRAAVVVAGITDWVSFSGTTDIPEENTRVHWGIDSFLERLPLLWDRSPMAHLVGARTPVLILHGEADARVPVSQGTELYTALRLSGVPVEMVTYPREGHGLKERAHRIDAAYRILDWLDAHLAAGSEVPPRGVTPPPGSGGARTGRREAP